MAEARETSLSRGAAVITLATAASRATGFLRVLVVAAAMGTTFLANTYQTANTAPNVMFELLAAGVLTSVFVPTFVDHLVRGQQAQGWRTADALASVALAALGALALLLALLAPQVMTALTLGVDDPDVRAREIDLGTTLLRLFSPQVVFYGAGVIMTGALHAHRRFALAAVAPIFNNVVVIGVYLLYAYMRGSRAPTIAGITTAETLVLGLGTTAGVVAMTLCLVPQLRGLGWHFRWRFEPRHPAVAGAVRLGVWALGYAGGYQAGLVVVLLLANGISGGVAAYQWAFTFFYVPHALLAVPVFHVLFPALAEHATRGDETAFVGRVRDGLAMLAFMLVPTAALLVVIAEPLARLALQYGAMTGAGAQLVARVVMAFAVGLPTYSAFLALTRAFYALGDTRTPALVNAVAVVVAAVFGAGMFAVAPTGWEVPGLAAGHSLGFGLGAALLRRSLGRRVSPATPPPATGVARAVAVGVVALGAMVLVTRLVTGAGRTAALVEVVVAATVGGAVYLGIMARARSTELARVAALLRSARP